MLRGMSVIGRLAVAAAIVLAFMSPPAVASPSGSYTYTVEHPTYGEIGTFTNLIRRRGDKVIVNTRIRIVARALFVPLYRFEADRTQVWRDGRLISYDSNTNDDGKTIILRGRAKADKFVINGPRGEAVVAGDVVPTNPWSMRFTKVRITMTTTTGRVRPASVVKRGSRWLYLGDEAIRSRYFKISGGQELWYDRRGVLVKFTHVLKGKVYVFTLQRPEGPYSAQADP